MRPRTLVVGVVATLLALPAPTASGAAPAALVPAPGTGHGVLTGAPPAENAGAFEYRPGLGGDCATPPGTIRIEPFTFGRNPLGYGEVGVPVALCFGSFPAEEIDVTITAPDGSSFAPRGGAVRSPREGDASTAVVLLVRPRPPSTTFRVEDLRGRSVGGRLEGNGSGAYTVDASGGTSATADFVLLPAARPRLVNLTVHRAGQMLARTARGERLRFGIAGMRPLATFEVGVFGPEPTSGDDGRPLRTTITARADRRGEAVVTLDVAATSPRGSFVAVLDPEVRVADPERFDPRVAIFEVADPPRS